MPEKLGHLNMLLRQALLCITIIYAWTLVKKGECFTIVYIYNETYTTIMVSHASGSNKTIKGVT